jgi:hypothetical protein
VKVGGREVQAFPPSRAQSLLQMNQPWTLKGNNPSSLVHAKQKCRK